MMLSIFLFIISLLTAKYKERSRYNTLFSASLIFIYLFISLLYFCADYFTGEGVNEAVIYTLKTGLKGAGFEEYTVLIVTSAVLFILSITVSYIYLRLIKNYNYIKNKNIKGVIHNLALILAFATHPLIWNLYKLYTSKHIKQSGDFYKYYKIPTLSKEKSNSYNLVYIYAESLERTYFDENIFPGLMPDLKKLKQKAIDFSNINQVESTGWTIGGMASSQCSVPLFTPSGGNSMKGMDSFFKNAQCLGDVLKQKGYQLVFMQGTSTYFSGIRNFYKTHKFDEIYGRKELIKKLKDKSYINEWNGLYDDSLLPMVYKKFIELSRSKKPFALILATIDTHHPKGMLSKSCQDIPYNDGKNPILNAVHCSDKLITEFIKKIQNSKYAKNTLIVLSSDHLAMRNSATNLLEKGKRRDLFLIFDPQSSKYMLIKKPGSMLDVAPTVLYKLGINTDLGLGRNLIKKNSLLTKFKHFNQKLLSWQKDILKLWDFKKIGLIYHIDIKRKSIYINEHKYKFPILIKVNNNRSITPYFEFDQLKQLDEYLIEFPKKQKFIWIDRCTKLNRAFKLKLKAKFCLVQGSLGSNLETIALKKKKETIDTENLFKSSNFDEKLYIKKLENIKSFQKCYK